MQADDTFHVWSNLYKCADGTDYNKLQGGFPFSLLIVCRHGALKGARNKYLRCSVNHLKLVIFHCVFVMFAMVFHSVDSLKNHGTISTLLKHDIYR